MRRALTILACLLSSCGGRVATDLPGDPPPPSPLPPTTSVPPRPPTRDPVPAPTPTPPPPTPSPGIVTASARASGLDHIEIFDANKASDTCTTLHIARPWTAQGSRFAGIAVPGGWTAINASRGKDASRCWEGAARAEVAATVGKGRVSWAPPPGDGFPCRIDVHVSITFEDSAVAHPIDADGVTVEGCTE